MRQLVASPFKFGFNILLALAITAPLTVMPVSAAAGTKLSAPLPTGLTISPSQKEITLSSGLLVATTTVSFTNNTSASVVGTIRILDFKTLDETGGLLFSQAGVSLSKYGLANWMTLPNGPTINVLSGKSVDIPVHIDNRADLAPGGHYGAVVITLGAPAVTGSNKAGFKQELVSLLFVKKLDGAVYSLQLQSLKADSHDRIPLIATTRFQNSGNVHVVPRGYVTVTDSAGKLLAKGTINPDSTILLPGTTRQLLTTLQPIATSHQSGHYKLTAYYRYDEQQTFSSSSISITGTTANHLLVWTSIAAVVLLAIGLFLLRRYLQHSRKKR
jgi:hypothetical protein